MLKALRALTTSSADVQQAAPALTRILAGFNRTLSELAALESKNTIEAEAAEARAADLRVRAFDLRDEAEKAAAISSRIRELIAAD